MDNSSHRPDSAIAPERVTVIDNVRGGRGAAGDSSAGVSSALAGSSIPQLQTLARWMDSAFHLPGSNISFGLDALLGLVPGLGDALTTFISLYILDEARKRGVPRVTMARMAMNTGLDFVAGSVPLVGDVFDVAWKANEKNVELLRRHVEAHPAAVRRQQAGDWLFVAALGALLITLLVGSVTIAWWILSLLGSALFGK